MLILMEAMMTGDTSLALERSERREQQSTVRAERLPIKVNSYSVPNDILYVGVEDSMGYEKRMSIIDENTKEWTASQYDAMGIKTLDEYDDLFLNVELPEGWEIKATDHSMWNDVFDNKGRKRITFFYKGAFYDRDAFSNFERRYKCNDVPFDNYETDASYEDRKAGLWYGKVYDCDKVIYTTEGIIGSDRVYGDNKLVDQCVKYLEENYPEYKDINAYWA